MTVRTTFTSIAFSVAITAAAQLGLGPGTRFTWVDARNEFKLGYGLHLSLQLNESARLNAEGYLTPWEDRDYVWDSPPAFGTPGPRFEKHIQYANWGLHLDLERDIGRAWFLSAGPGYSSFHTSRTDSVTGSGTNERTQAEEDDRLLALDLGFGKRWRIGPGDLRAGVSAALIGYGFDNAYDRFTWFETYGVSLSYQVRIGAPSSGAERSTHTEEGL